MLNDGAYFADKMQIEDLDLNKIKKENLWQN